MQNPRLIQRGTFRVVEDEIYGIDTLIDLDYMGAAEFEFGALPRSLKEMCRSADKQDIYATGIKAHDGRGLFVVCTELQAKEAITHVRELVSPRCTYRLKEPTRLESSLSGKDFRGEPLKSYNNFDFWWDIDNNYMFCLSKKNAKNLIKAIVAVRDRKQQQAAEGWY